MIAARISNLAVGSNQHVHRVKRDLAKGVEFSTPLRGVPISDQHERPEGPQLMDPRIPQLEMRIERLERTIRLNGRLRKSGRASARTNIWRNSPEAAAPETNVAKVVGKDRTTIAKVNDSLRQIGRKCSQPNECRPDP